MLSNSIIFVSFNTIALLIYFLLVCNKYGCVYKIKNIPIFNLPLGGIFMPLKKMVTNFPEGISMMVSFKNAWVYMFIASIMAVVTIMLLRKYKKKDTNDRSQPSVAR